MSTKKLGYGITAVGIAGALMSIIIDYLGFGDGGIQAAQIVGIVAGLLIAVFGLSMVRLVPEKTIYIGSSLRAWGERFIELPISVWFVIGFLIVYVLLFLSPVFLNTAHSMTYFNRYLPDRNPIGSDMSYTLEYVKSWVTTRESPYPASHYPPLTYVLLSPLTLFSYPVSYLVTTILTVSSYLLATLLLPFLFNPKKDFSLGLLLSVTGLFSYGFLFELERGQYYTLAFLLSLLAIYIFHRHYEFRYLAYVLFSFSVHLKIVPIFFIPMFIKDWRDWKGNIWCMTKLGIFNIALLFALGYRNLVNFVEALLSRVERPTFLWNGNHSLANFVLSFKEDGYGLLSDEVVLFLQKNAGWFERFLLVIVALCVLSIIVNMYRNRMTAFNSYLLLVCTLCALVIPVSIDYTLPMLVAPMAIFLSSETNLKGSFLNKLVSIVLVLVMSISYASLLYPFKYKPQFLDNSFPALFLILIAVTLYYFLQGKYSEDTTNNMLVVE